MQHRELYQNCGLKLQKKYVGAKNRKSGMQWGPKLNKNREYT